ncbi:hypothetical protein DRO31_05260 [Candidatus Bathyarchaeota archaeon]|nr:MAG: hypothetical protein DRO31_05260 [Candidatus Bathyarchaeota archaeon]
MKAKIKKITQQDKLNEPRILIDIIDEDTGEVVVENFTVIVPIEGLSAAPDKTVFVSRLINDILKGYKNKKKAAQRIKERLVEIKEGFEITCKEEEPHAFSFMTPKPVEQVEKAKALLKTVDLNKVTSVNDIKVLLKLLLVYLGLRDENIVR